jgi:hypothetical protein
MEDSDPIHKRRRAAKKSTTEQTAMSANSTDSTFTSKGQASKSIVKRSKKSSESKIDSELERKSGESQAPRAQHNLDKAQVSPTISHSTDGDLPQESHAMPTKIDLSTALPADVQPTLAANEATKSEGIDIRMRFLERSVKVLGWLFNLSATAIVSILLGFSSPVSSIPILDFFQHYTVIVLAILCVAGISILILLLILPLMQKRLRPMDGHLKTMGAVTSVSMLISILCLFLLTVTLSRPSWCPTSLCPAPKIITEPITTTQGFHDANLDVYFISFQSTAYVIPGDPQLPDYIPSSGDPRSIGAVLLGTPPTSELYTVAIGLHSLYTGPYPILIDQVRLLLTKVNPVPNPLHVYPVILLTKYSTTNPSRFIYQGQKLNETITDTYSTNPLPRVELRSGESDQIDAIIESRVPIDMQFRIQITYHIATQTQRSMLTLPQIYEVVFSNASNWKKYQLNLDQNNFAPEPGS